MMETKEQIKQMTEDITKIVIEIMSVVTEDKNRAIILHLNNKQEILIMRLK